MTKIDIFSGFLGAGKTTLIKKLINESFKGEKLVLIENEFGEIGIDGGFLKESGINITEMNSGCICCSLVGDFCSALQKVMSEYKPDRILIEPSGVGKLSDVVNAVNKVSVGQIFLNSYTTVVDVNRCKIYMKNFGEFFCDQIKNAKCIILSHTDNATEEKITECIEPLRKENKDAVIVSTPVYDLNGKQLLDAIEGASTIQKAVDELTSHEICPECGHHHHHEHHHDECSCEHNHEHKHEHHHHHHDGECDCHHHEHEHHHHHADEIFQSIGIETTNKFSKEDLESILSKFSDSDKFGSVLRAKGIVHNTDNTWLHFDYMPDFIDIRSGNADIIGRICIIGSNINEETIKSLFA